MSNMLAGTSTRSRRINQMVVLRSQRTATRCSSECSTSYPAHVSTRRALMAATALIQLVSAPRQARAAAELPKAYTNTARSLVDALRDSIDADLSGASEREVRRKADPAKDLVRQFMSQWRDAPLVRDEESYRQLTAAIQELGQFYQAQGQRTRLSEGVGEAVLTALEAAKAALPPAPEKTSLLPF